MEKEKRFFQAILILLLFLAQPDADAENRFAPVDSLVVQSIAGQVFPSASIAVIYKGETVFHKAYGRLTYDRRSPAADTTTIYDLASLTKPVVTTSVIMQLSERDSIDIDAPVSRYLPEFSRNGKQEITIKNLLLHNSGLIAHRFFIRTCSTPDEVMQAICNEPLQSPPGSNTKYSDLGFITLGRIIERITGRTLAENFRARFSQTLGMHSTMFNPPFALHGLIAPTERDTSWHLEKERPLVHDHNAALLGGEAGNAGLFSTSGDLAVFVRMLMNEGRHNGQSFFSAATLKRFTERYPGSRSLGWDLRSIEGRSSSGDYFSAASYGHLGYTGTSIWIDPEKDLAVIALTNRVYPTSENIRIRGFRPELHNTVVRCLELVGK
ncbi:serine hydrolase [Prosthecochloris sp. GSB1]|uniref:serine hydrolase domain-containing protein n=1 Tax=Prosthecochloris sp. GSB1 TaxID=281093 RepID=UPI000B8CC17A|nr:serine hydrolase domain-containing protein [Prosthecochloris sp. GSB1]ASQ89985.1 serine hydrolase [Prosthecochloris sp. GSB1]